MRRTRIRRALDAIAPPYDPAYPAKLSPAEHRRIVEQPVRRRVQRIAAAIGMAAAGTSVAPAQDSRTSPSREERVLELLAPSVLGSLGSFHDTALVPVPALSHMHFRPRISMSFGNSYSGVFDLGEAKRLAREMFEVYGITVERGAIIETEAVHARVDGLDRKKRVGFKLRGGALTATGFNGSPAAAAESSATDLDGAEVAALKADGFRVHIADANDFYGADGDFSTAYFAYLASVVDFLNAVTDGPKVDVMQLAVGLQERLARPRAEDVSAPPDAKCTAVVGAVKIEMATRGSITIRVTHEGDAVLDEASRSGPSRVLDRPLSTAGSPTILRIPFGSGGAPAGRDFGARLGSSPVPSKFRVTQTIAGKAPVTIESTSPSVLMPSSFDAALPFSITLEVGPGTLTLDSGPTVRVMPR